MSIPIDVTGKMEYIQGLFLSVQEFMRRSIEMDKLIVFLEKEDLEFRSVAYESASLQLGLKDLSKGTNLSDWNSLYRQANKGHHAHMFIGLGWALAQARAAYDSLILPFKPDERWLIFDGMGYYYALYKGRRTVIRHILPEGISSSNINGFDQGVGRRLWYIAKGKAVEVAPLVEKFPIERHQDLWRGIGLATGYVGGCQDSELEALHAVSGKNGPDLSKGIAMAALNRTGSDSLTKDIERACELICKQHPTDIAHNFSYNNLAL